MTETLQQKVQKALDQVRPQIQMDGGDVEFVALEGNVVKVRLVGHCAGCPMATMTLKQGIEAHVKRTVPEITKVESVQ
jgi:Fe-S cluster biogenesis protein NfuA